MRAGDVRVAYPLFQAEGGGSIPTSALQLRFEVIDRYTMEALNRKWHSRLPRLSTACPCPAYYGAEFDGIWYAVAAWSHPISPQVDQTWMELRRFAIAEDAPKNTASRMLSWMVRDIRKRFPAVPRLVSYQDTAVHAGTIYKASGWECCGVVSNNSGWSGKSTRYRRPDVTTTPKQRWELGLAR